MQQVQILKLACRAAGITQDALQEALKDAAVRAQIEVLKKREAELEAEVDKLRASEDVLHEDQKLQRKFKWSVMINVSINSFFYISVLPEEILHVPFKTRKFKRGESRWAFERRSTKS